jgi:serine phosphatase RsbU (regulator of sigma subunit)
METELDQAALLKQIEIKRLESISNLGNLDKLRKSEIQTVPALVKNLLGVEAAGISVLDENTQHFLAESGLGKTEVPRSGSPCNLTMQSEGSLVIENWEQDARNGEPENPFDMERCFYAGVPLINPEGLAMGTLFGMSSNSQDRPSAEQLALLAGLARMVTEKILALAEVQQLSKQIARLNLKAKLSNNLTKEVARQRQLVEEAREEIHKSIRSASRIQNALLPKKIPADLDVSILWKPLNIVGGDIYILEDLGDDVVIAVLDCTGHGVPGALLSTITSAAFDRAMNDPAVKTAGQYLTTVHQLIKNILNQHDKAESTSDEGFDGSICIYHREQKELSFASARNSMLVISGNGEVQELKGDRKSVGSVRVPLNYAFKTSQIPVQDQIFVMYTDGITDVMNEGENPKLFGKHQLTKSLQIWSDHSPQKVANNISIAIENYRGTEPLKDDQTMLIFRVK